MELGITQEELREIVVTRLVDQLSSSHEYHTEYERIEERVSVRLTKLVNERVDAFMSERLPSFIDKALNEVGILQPTQRYGQPPPPPLSFAEYCAIVAKQWLTEKVDYQGRAEYGSSRDKARIVWLVQNTLADAIEREVKNVLEQAHVILGSSIQDVVTASLSRITAAVKVSVEAKR